MPGPNEARPTDPRWPNAIPPVQVVHHGADWVVVEKPVGMPTIDPIEGAGGSLVEAIEAQLRGRVSVHSRLDAETSGLVIFGTSELGAKTLARAFESRTVQKEYLAIVEGRGEPPVGRLVDRLRDEGDEVVLHPRGADARARCQVVARRGSKALLRLQLETGRRHQLRVQLASRGFAIVGDTLYGGRSAPRLMLHASRLALAGAAWESPMPTLLRAELDGGLDPRELLRAALDAALARRVPGARRSGGDLERLFNEESDGVPGLAIDRLEAWGVLHLHDCAIAEAQIIDELAERAGPLGLRGLYVKRRPKSARDLVKADLEAHAPSAPVWGEPAPRPLVVNEGPLTFELDLADGMSTGLFVDQRETRERVRREAAGLRVLNLFAYTCGFTVAAAVGGASHTVSVDASKRALERGRANLERNGHAGPAHQLRVDDCFEALRRMHARGERYDLVCVDPPTFATTKRSRWESGRGWVGLLAAVLQVCAPSARILATSNDRRMDQAGFRAYARQALEGLRARVVDLRAPLDVRGMRPSVPGWKGLWIELGDAREEPRRCPD